MSDVTDESIDGVHETAIAARAFIYDKANGDQASVATVLSILMGAELASLHPAKRNGFMAIFLKASAAFMHDILSKQPDEEPEEEQIPKVVIN